jgi:hypothetical protein
LSAFIIAYECKLYPPLWVLSALAQSFESYYKNQGSDSLDRFLGLEPGPGQTPPFKAASLRARNRSLARDIWLLNLRFGLSIDEAVDVVCGRLNMRTATDGILTQQNMASEFSKKWKKEFGLTKEHYDYLARNYSNEDWRSYLKRFPTDTLHEKVKVKLKVK